MSYVATLACETILSTPLNPRTEVDEDIGDLAIAMGSEDDSLLVHMPVVERVGNGYRIVAGERRVRAARLAGHVSMQCVVHDELDPVKAMHMRLSENMHRRDVAPIDEAAALKIAWLAENAIALGSADQIRAILARHEPPRATIDQISTVLASLNFKEQSPPVPWDMLLSRLGIAMQIGKRKRLLRLLHVDSAVAGDVRDMGLSMAATHSMGYLQPDEQRQVVQAVKNKPELASQVRRIGRTVTSGMYTIDQALQEANMVIDSSRPSSHASPQQQEGDDDESVGNNAQVMLQRLVVLAAEISILSMDIASDMPHQSTFDVALAGEVVRSLQECIAQLQGAVAQRQVA